MESFSFQELTTIDQIIRVTQARGGFRIEEMGMVIPVYDKVSRIIKYVTDQQQQQQQHMNMPQIPVEFPHASGAPAAAPTPTTPSPAPAPAPASVSSSSSDPTPRPPAFKGIPASAPTSSPPVSTVIIPQLPPQPINPQNPWGSRASGVQIEEC